MKVVALAGGVGGAKLAHGLAQILAPEDLTVIVNTGDDFGHLGLAISPDLDTVMYTLAGLANPETGWGRVDETWNFLGALQRLEGETWFRLGDRDLATHIERSRRLWAGQRLTEVTAALCTSLGVRARLLPMTDHVVRTIVQTDEGDLEFQRYFVQRRCEPRITGFRIAGLNGALPTQAVESALTEADLIVFCPSNPFVSLDPILGLRGVRERILQRGAIAVSPIVGGQALKGPAAKMFTELGFEPSPLAVAQHYAGLLHSFVLDTVDAPLALALNASGLRVLTTNTVMKNEADRRQLATEILAFCDRAN